MGGEWIDTKLGDVLTLKRGYDLPTQDRHAGPFPVVSSSGVTGWHVESKAKAPGVVTGRYGTLGEIYYLTQDYWPLNTTLYVKEFKGNDPRFISYFLKGLNFASYNDKSSVPGLNRNHLHSEVVYFPADLSEQRHIADILGTLDDKIELNRQMNRTLEAMARTIFKAWFVDFEPVKAKAAGAQSFRGIPQAVFDQLPDRFTDTEMGPVPEGWEVKPIGSIASISRDSMTPADSPDEIFEHFSIPAFDAGMRPGRDLGSSIKSNKYAVSPHCVLVSKLNPRFARVWLPDEPTNGARQICSTEFLVITPKDGWSREQLFCQFVEVGFRKALEQRASGTSSSHQRIKPKDFEKTIVVSPPMKVREAFVGSVGPLFAKAANGHRESQTLAALRDTLLPKLISGQLRVPVAEEGADGG